MSYLSQLEAKNPLQCSPKGVYGLAQLSEVRRKGLKPASVQLEVVSRADRTFSPFLIADGPFSLRLQISVDAEFKKIDFRPLVGLDVHMHNDANDTAAFRKVADMVWYVPTRLLVLNVPTANGEVLYIRRGSVTEVHRP